MDIEIERVGSPRRLGHANLFVGEIERSMRFYNRVCGLEEVFRERTINAGFLTNGNSHHDIGMVQVGYGAQSETEDTTLLPDDLGKWPGLFHLAFEMDNE